MKLWYSLSKISRVVAEKAFFGKEFSRFILQQRVNHTREDVQAVTTSMGMHTFRRFGSSIARSQR